MSLMGRYIRHLNSGILIGSALRRDALALLPAVVEEDVADSGLIFRP